MYKPGFYCCDVEHVFLRQKEFSWSELSMRTERSKPRSLITNEDYFLTSLFLLLTIAATLQLELDCQIVQALKRGLEQLTSSCDVYEYLLNRRKGQNPAFHSITEVLIFIFLCTCGKELLQIIVTPLHVGYFEAGSIF